MIRLQTVPSGKIPSDANHAIFCFEKAKKPTNAYLYGSKLDSLFQAAKKDGFSGAKGQVHVLSSGPRQNARTLFIGLGKENEADLQTVRLALALATRTAERIQLSSLYLRPPQLGRALALSQAATEGVLLAAHRFDKYKSTAKPKQKLKTLSFIIKDASESQAFRTGIQVGTLFAEATCLARDLISTPPSDMIPDQIAKMAHSLTSPLVKLRVYRKQHLQKMGMGGILGVNRGSAKPPCFLHLVYRPRGRSARKRIGICGKGITFDSGGLSLKPPKAMETMKMDMSGAAAVLGVFKALTKLRPRVEVHGFAAVTENMPGANAVKPGDVLKAYNGKTIEVLNTDAEGRLVLADALSFASKQNLTEVIDLATLTGACIVALGNDITAIMGNNPKLIGRLKDISAISGEKMWELPLEKEYESHIKSPLADVKNMGRPMQAGTIIGGIFLKEFVDEKLPWVHLDIAGTAWVDSDQPLARTGGTGSMVRTLLHYILSQN